MAEQIFENPDMLPEVRQGVDKLQILRRSIVEKALSLVGAMSIKYVSSEQGMGGEDGFDCSGFVSYVVGSTASDHSIELSVPRHANEQWREFGEPVAYKQRRAGDLVFFPSKHIAGIRLIGHVGLVISPGQYIHAPGKHNTRVRLDELPLVQKEFAYNHPDDVHIHDPAGIKRITIPVGDGRWHVH